MSVFSVPVTIGVNEEEIAKVVLCQDLVQVKIRNFSLF